MEDKLIEAIIVASKLKDEQLREHSIRMLLNLKKHGDEMERILRKVREDLD